MERPAIPAEIRRAVLVEAGHRCAIPRCGETEIDVHHIVPWEKCHKHEFSNLIALCLICHRRTHKGEIDRKSLVQYKAALASIQNNNTFDAPIIEIKRRISEKNKEVPGYDFEFDFPDFQAPARRVVSKNLEAWGNELLMQFRERQEFREHQELGESIDAESFDSVPSLLRGAYQVIRDDEFVISIEYIVNVYISGAAHGRESTFVQNFLIRPFQPITLLDLISEQSSISHLALFIRKKLLECGEYDEEWVISGTQPEESNFSLFVLDRSGIQFIFEEYQIAPYIEGRQRLHVSFDDLAHIGNPFLFQKFRT